METTYHTTTARDFILLKLKRNDYIGRLYKCLIEYHSVSIKSNNKKINKLKEKMTYLEKMNELENQQLNTYSEEREKQITELMKCVNEDDDADDSSEFISLISDINYINRCIAELEKKIPDRAEVKNYDIKIKL
jgi:hypothetical protein